MTYLPTQYRQVVSNTSSTIYTARFMACPPMLWATGNKRNQDKARRSRISLDKQETLWYCRSLYRHGKTMLVIQFVTYHAERL